MMTMNAIVTRIGKALRWICGVREPSGEEDHCAHPDQVNDRRICVAPKGGFPSYLFIVLTQLTRCA